jgi:hypothetical protein
VAYFTTKVSEICETEMLFVEPAGVADGVTCCCARPGACNYGWRRFAEGPQGFVNVVCEFASCVSAPLESSRRTLLFCLIGLICGDSRSRTEYVYIQEIIVELALGIEFPCQSHKLRQLLVEGV